MGGQVEDDAAVVDARRERPLPPGDDLEDLAELAEIQSPTLVLQRRVEPSLWSTQPSTPLRERLQNRLGGLGVVRQRLLDEGGNTSLH